MILSINTSQDIYKFGLYWDNFHKEFSALRKDKKDALFLIDKFLRENRVKIADLKAIAVYNGAGSYTGVRVGVTIANALSFSLKIPVFGFTSHKLIKQDYLKLKKKKYEAPPTEIGGIFSSISAERNPPKPHSGGAKEDKLGSYIKPLY